MRRALNRPKGPGAAVVWDLLTFEHAALAGDSPVLLTSPAIRPYVRSIIERFRGQTPVMSQNEVHPRAKLKTVYADLQRELAAQSPLTILV